MKFWSEPGFSRSEVFAEALKCRNNAHPEIIDMYILIGKPFFSLVVETMTHSNIFPFEHAKLLFFKT